MSGSRRGPQGASCAWALCVAVFLLGGACISRAEAGAGLQDPLSALPPALAEGATLPGDREPVVCTPGIADTEPMPLYRAVDLALCHNPQLKAGRSTIGVQAAALGEANAAYLPTLQGSVSEMHNRSTYPAGAAPDRSERGRTAQLGLAWRLFDFGARDAHREAAGQWLAAALAGHDAALQQVLLSVIGAYFEAVAAQAEAGARHEAAGLARATLDAVARRASLGAAAASDRLQAEVAAAKAQLQLNRAEDAARTAASALAHAIGSDASEPLPRLPGTLEPPVQPRVEVLDRWLLDIQDVQQRHPAVLAARAKWVAADAKAAAVQAEGLPSLDFAANRYRNGYPNQGLSSTRSDITTVGVTLSVPLFDGFARRYKILGAQAATGQAEAEWQEAGNKVSADLRKAHAQAVSALRNLDASATLLGAAQAASESSGRRYARGAADIVELLATQAALGDAALERVRCLAQWQSARLRLVAAAGQLGLGGLAP